MAKSSSTAWPLKRVVAAVISAVFAFTAVASFCSLTVLRTEQAREMGPLVTLSMAVAMAVASGITWLYVARYAHPDRRRQEAGRGCLAFMVGGFIGGILGAIQLFLLGQALPQLSASLYVAGGPLGAAIGGALALLKAHRGSDSQADTQATAPPPGPDAAS